MIIRGGVDDTRLEAKAKDTKNSKAKDRLSLGRGQGHRCTCSPKKGLQNFFSGDFHLRKAKKGLRKFSARFLAFSNKISTVQKIVLSSRPGQGNFRGLEASKPRPRTSKCVLVTKNVLEDTPLVIIR